MRYFFFSLLAGVLVFFFSLMGSEIESFDFSFGGVFLIFVLLFVAFIVLEYEYQVCYMKSYFYDLIRANLVVRKGVFSTNEITLPINRLQDVYVDQDVLDRIFGLYDVHVSSATMISARLSHIDGLNKENAEAIKNLILSAIQKENA